MLLRNTASDTVNDQLSNPIYRVTGAGENVGLNARIHVDKDSYVAYSKSFYGLVKLGRILEAMNS